MIDSRVCRITWDSHEYDLPIAKLWELAADLPAETVDAAVLLESVSWFPRSALETVREIRAALWVDMAHPVILGPDWRLMDGGHRCIRSLLDPALRGVPLLGRRIPEWRPILQACGAFVLRPGA